MATVTDRFAKQCAVTRSIRSAPATQAAASQPLPIRYKPTSPPPLITVEKFLVIHDPVRSPWLSLVVPLATSTTSSHPHRTTWGPTPLSSQIHTLDTLYPSQRIDSLARGTPSRVVSFPELFHSYLDLPTMRLHSTDDR